jgi:hypothetical protein
MSVHTHQRFTAIDDEREPFKQNCPRCQENTQTRSTHTSTMETIPPNLRRADILFIRRTKTTDGIWIGYFFAAEGQVWINFRSVQEVERWRTAHGYALHFII